MASVLSSEFKLGATDSSKLLAKAGCPFSDVAGALKRAYGLTAKQTAASLKQSLGVSDKAMVAFLQGGGYGIREVAGVASDTANTAKKVTGTVTKGVSDEAKKAGDTVNKAGNAVKNAFKL